MLSRRLLWVDAKTCLGRWVELLMLEIIVLEIPSLLILLTLYDAHVNDVHLIYLDSQGTALCTSPVQYFLRSIGRMGRQQLNCHPGYLDISRVGRKYGTQFGY
jgi:hypothetical protein